MSPTYTDQFGFLSVNADFASEGGTVTSSPSFKIAENWMDRYVADDGWVYPHHIPRPVRVADGFLTVPVPESGRPSNLFRLPTSDLLKLDVAPPTQEAARYGLAGLIIHLLGFLYGNRCHFHDWWIEGRVPLENTCDHHLEWVNEFQQAFEWAVSAWLKWPEKPKAVAINALFLHCRAPMHYWSWERFQAEYQVFDAIYAVALALGRVSRVPHACRLQEVCETFDLAVDRARCDAIVKLRNELIHEVLWDGRMPGEHRGEASFRAPFWLHNISKRAFLALCGLHGQYVKSEWWSIQVHVFQVSR